MAKPPKLWQKPLEIVSTFAKTISNIMVGLNSCEFKGNQTMTYLEALICTSTSNDEFSFENENCICKESRIVIDISMI